MADVPMAPAAPAVSTAQRPDEILSAFAGPAPQNRLTVLVRLVLLVPQAVFSAVLAVAACAVAVIGWFAALAIGRLPVWAAGFLTGWLRYYARVTAYGWLLTDRYPPFALGDADYPVRLAAAPGRLNRFAVLFRGILAFPVLIVALLAVQGVGTVAAVVIWLIALIGGRLPDALHQALTAVLRYLIRVYGYLFLITATYPHGLFGDGAQPAAAAWDAPGLPVEAAPEPPPAVAGAAEWRLVLSGRAKDLVRMFLGLGVLMVFVNGYLGSSYGVGLGFGVSAGTGDVAQRAAAAAAIAQANLALSNSMRQEQAAVAACRTLACATRQDLRAAAAFGAFGSALRSAPVPSGAAATASARVEQDAARTAATFRRLASAATVTQYQQFAATSGLQQRLNQMATDYRQLGVVLGAVKG